MDQVDAGWSVREFAGLDLGDARLNQRLLSIAEAFGAQNPQVGLHRGGCPARSGREADAVPDVDGHY